METSIIENVIAPVLSLGLPGVIIVALAFGVYRLANLYHDVQEKRIEENREAVKAMGETAKAIDSLSELIRDRARG